MAEDLLDTIGQLFGPMRGGLAYAVIFVGALLAATTGVVAASVISMGLISLPIMLRYGYDRRVATGVIAASGTLAQIIPPSLVLIIMADQLGKSVGDIYAGAFIPGITLAGLYALYIAAVTGFRPTFAPALPPEARTLREASGASGVRSLLVLTAIAVASAVAYAKLRMADRALDETIVVSTSMGAGVAFFAAVLNRLLKLGLLSRIAERVTFVMIPPLALIFLVLGTIFLGVATPTEGGAMGATGALIMALARRRLTLSLLRQAMDTTAKLSTFVVFILVGARVFSLTFYGVNGNVWVEHLLTSLPGGQLGFLIVVNILIFVLAFFLDFFELSFIIIPLVGPVADKLGIDLIWFGVLLAVNMQTSFMHPPFGFALVLPAQRRGHQGLPRQADGQADRPRHDRARSTGARFRSCSSRSSWSASSSPFRKWCWSTRPGESKIDPNSIHIEVPVDVPSMSGAGNPQNSEQEQAEKALDKLFGEPATSEPAPGDANAPAAGGATAPAIGAPPANGTPPADAGTANPPAGTPGPPGK